LNTDPSRKNIPTVILFIVVLALFVLSAVAAVYFYSEAQALSNVQKTTTTATVVEQSPGAVLSSVNYSALGFNPQLIYSLTNRSVVTVEGAQLINTGFGTVSEEVLGSGFVVNYSGHDYIVTNDHVVAGDSNLTVSFADGDGYPATVVGADPYADLAVVNVTGAPLVEFIPLNMTFSSSLRVGQPVLAIGNPFGLVGSMTFGIVSQLGRTIQDVTSGNYSIADVVQFSAPINPGNSGGPLLDANGAVVGITTAGISNSQGVGFAIPSETILRELPSLVKTGAYNQHPLIGIQGFDMSYLLARAAGTNITYGVLIASVLPGGPAALAGLRGGNTSVTINGQSYTIGGDIIISINGTKILSTDSLSTYLEENTMPGGTIQVEAIRSGALQNFTVIVGTRPPPTTG
jgi:S1-C subfamily serine protease